MWMVRLGALADCFFVGGQLSASRTFDRGFTPAEDNPPPSIRIGQRGAGQGGGMTAALFSCPLLLGRKKERDREAGISGSSDTLTFQPVAISRVIR
jgi:hypothetical protein